MAAKRPTCQVTVSIVTASSKVFSLWKSVVLLREEHFLLSAQEFDSKLVKNMISCHKYGPNRETLSSLDFDRLYLVESTRSLTYPPDDIQSLDSSV